MASGNYTSPWRLATVALVLILLLALPLVFMKVKSSSQKAERPGPAEYGEVESSGPNPISLISRETAVLHVKEMVESKAFTEEKRRQLVDRQMKAYDLLRRLAPDKFTIDTLNDLKTRYYPDFRRIYSNYLTRSGLLREGHDWRKKAR